MSLAVLMEKIQERLNQVDQNNRKVVAIFQVKAGDANWVIDLKDLKVYEGVAENPDSTMIGDEESIAKLIRKEMTFAEATAEGKVKVEGNVELTTKAFEARG